MNKAVLKKGRERGDTLKVTSTIELGSECGARDKRMRK
jgi:hypothetical protein